MKPWRAVLSLGLCLSILPNFACGEEPGQKAARYHKLLLKRPESSTLLERFVDAWLDEGSKEGLETFLNTQAGAGEGAAGWGVLAAYQQWAGREEEALAAISSALEKLPGDPKLLLARAKLRAGLLDYEGALVDLDLAGDEDTEVAGETATLRGTYLARAGRQEEAVEAWEAMLDLRPGDEELREDLIELEVGEGLFDEAIKTARELAESSKDPYQKALRLLRAGSIEIMAGRKDAGLATYEKIVTMTGEDSWLEREVLAQVEKAFLSGDDVTGLRQFYQKLREQFPQRVSLRKGLARQMVANGETDEAITLFREVLAITPGDQGNREDFIALLETAGRPADAAGELDALIRDDPGRPELWTRMAKLRDLAGEPENRDAALARVQDLRAGTPAGVVQTAVLFESYDELAKSEAILREGRTSFPADQEIPEALAALLAGADEKEKQAEATEIWRGMAEGAGLEVLLGAARSLLAHGQSDASFAVLQARADEFSDDAIFLTQLCQAGLTSGQVEAAFPYALSLARLAADPTDMDAALKQVRALGRDADLATQITKLEALPDKKVADWCILSELNEQLGDTAAAETALTEAEALDDGLLAASQRVRLLQSRGDSDAAADAMAALIERPGGARPVYYRKLVALLVSAGREDEALAAVDVWKRASPGDESAWLRRAELLGEAGRPGEVVQELRRALAQFSGGGELQARLAAALFEAGDTAGAERAYRKLYDTAEDTTSKNRWVREMAILADREGRTAELLADFERRKRTSPQDIAPLLAIAEIHEVLQDYDARREAISEAARRQPKDTGLLIELSALDENAGEYDRALVSLQAAVKADPGPKSRQKLADFYFRNGDIELGLGEIRSLQGNDPREIEKTALSLNEAGEWRLALQHLAAAPRRDWRLDLLEALATYKSGAKEKARPLFYALLRNETAIPGLKPMLNPDELAVRTAHIKEYGITETGLQARYLMMLQLFSNQPRSARGNAPRPGLPGSPAELHAYVLAFLVGDIGDAPKEEKQALVDNLPFRDTEFGTRIRLGLLPPDWVRAEYDAGKIDLKTFITYCSNADESATDILEKGVEELAQSEPDLADTACALLMSLDRENSEKWLGKRLDLLSSVNPKNFEFNLNAIVYEIYQLRDGIAYSDGMRARAGEIIRGNLSALKPEHYWFGGFHWTSVALREAWKAGEAEEVVKLMNLASNLPDPPAALVLRQQSQRYYGSIELAPPAVSSGGKRDLSRSAKAFSRGQRARQQVFRSRPGFL